MLAHDVSFLPATGGRGWLVDKNRPGRMVENEMKRAYRSLQLVEYGKLEEITLGSGGTLPDYVSGIDVNNTCNTQSFTYTTTGGAVTTAYRNACTSS